MAMNKTKYGRKKVLDHFFGRSAYAFPANVWLALLTADPTDAGLLTNELTQAGYARAGITSSLADAVLATGVISNSALITIGPAAEDWPEVTHIGIMDSATIGAGNMIYYGPLATSRSIDLADTFKVNVGQLTVEEL